MTHIDQRAFNQPATSSVAGKEREREVQGECECEVAPVNLKESSNTFIKNAISFHIFLVLSPFLTPLFHLANAFIIFRLS